MVQNRWLFCNHIQYKSVRGFKQNGSDPDETSEYEYRNNVGSWVSNKNYTWSRYPLGSHIEVGTQFNEGTHSSTTC